MGITHTIKNNILIITFDTDRLDIKDSAQLKQDIINLINEKKNNRVVIDLQRLTFVDSSGIGVFLSLSRNLNSQGGELKLAGITTPVRTTFELVSLHKIFEIFKTTDEAISSFKPIVQAPPKR